MTPTAEHMSYAAQVVSECVRYFCKFESFEDQLPVIWHQSLLILVTHYKRKFRYVLPDDDNNCGTGRDDVFADQIVIPV
ncbi:U3/U14 snoRNA-associated small subunit rRNA processing protein, putative [Babesia caballi]|uniref:U3/U14 snoRNA-associated small subunit rRNA processing protein, putative n=1 Tax=Babesia caballi TaxID=5871 RepID=A0AAV4LZ84_BABCB|nr:U3/U14 snoRNA-associated small subunit rRNA processing protein, putative [Babesia caballi]